MKLCCLHGRTVGFLSQLCTDNNRLILQCSYLKLHNSDTWYFPTNYERL